MGWSSRGHSWSKGPEVGTNWKVSVGTRGGQAVWRGVRAWAVVGASCARLLDIIPSSLLSHWRTLCERIPGLDLGWYSSGCWAEMV